MRLNGSEIAVIGMAARVPGARSAAEFWQNLHAGTESIRVLTDAELIAAGETPENLSNPGYVRALGTLDGFDSFDAGLFGFSPQDAAIMDPQHRVLLEVAWEALENAARTPESVHGSVGVFATCGMNTYMMHNLQHNRRIMNSVGEWLVRHTGNDMNFLATRLSYQFNLSGPSMNVQTACSSALVAIHLASQSLLMGECDMALAGGCTLNTIHRRGYVHKPGEILSPDGHCRPFDHRGAGTVLSNGAGMVVLRRLSDALAGGDRIAAVILGSAMNNDGSRKAGYLAPGVEGQSRAIAEALAASGASADTISMIEAHGTGTHVGDPIEVAALTQAFRRSTPRKSFCALGSVKSNFGHLGEAAGVVSLIKTVLALQHREIPATLNFEKPNPQIDFANSPFFVNTELREWKPQGGTRRAGVTAIGAGGTNCHVILEEAPPSRASGPSRPWQLLTLSAAHPDAVKDGALHLAEHLKQHPELCLADAAFTLNLGRKAFPYRRFAVCRDHAEAAAALESTAPPTQRAASEPSVTFLLTGQGSQYPRMAWELYRDIPVFSKIVDECAEILKPELGLDLREALYAGAGDLTQTRLTQPALFTIEYAMAKLLMSWGVKPRAMIGHSVGELVAACLAGVFTLPGALRLVAARGELMQSMPPGAMLAVPLSAEEAVLEMNGKAASGALALAAENGPGLSVVAGSAETVAQFASALAEKGIATRPLKTSHAFHSPMMDAATGPFRERVRATALHPPQIPFISNVTGTWITAAQATDPEYWAQHLRQPVRFAQGLAAVLEDPSQILLEAGPGRTLSTLARQQTVRPLAIVESIRRPDDGRSDLAVLLNACGELWSHGVALDWEAFWDGQQRRRVELPTYAFQRQAYWIEPDSRVEPGLQDRGTAPRQDEANWFYRRSWQKSAAAASERRRKTWLVFLDEVGLGEAVVRKIAAEGGPHEVFRVRAGRKFEPIGEREFRIRPAVREDYQRLFEALGDAAPRIDAVAHFWNVTAKAEGGWEQHLDRGYLSLSELARSLRPANPDQPVPDQPIELRVFSNRLYDIAGETEVEPAKATLAGACRVIPREFEGLLCGSVDVELAAPGGWQWNRLVQQLAAELESNLADRAAAYRGSERWAERFEPARLEESGTALRPQGVYLITGGMSRAAAELAGHLAQSVQARLILVDRDLPGAGQLERIKSWEALGAEVLIARACATDARAMRAAVQAARKAFGRVHGVFHMAGSDGGQPIAQQEPNGVRQALRSQIEGALVLETLFRDTALDFLSVFSPAGGSVGLPGAAESAAADAFLTAFAAHQSKRGLTRTVAIGWREWGDSGETSAAPDETVVAVTLDSRADWMLAEHVIEGQHVLPATGYLELVRSALGDGAADRAVEIRDVVFQAPLKLRPDQTVEVAVARRADSRFAVRSGQTHVTGRALLAAQPPPAGIDLEAIRQRCNQREEVSRPQGHSFVEFGPRWRSLKSIRYGADQALVELELPPEYRADLEPFPLHPALLDLATGAAQGLIPGCDAERDFYVPFSYGRLLLRRGLPAHLFSHVRLTGPATFDATLADQNGAVVAEVTGFVMRRMEERSRLAFGSAKGMTPEQALGALERILAAPCGAQVVVSPVDLEEWMSELDQAPKPLAAGATGSANIARGAGAPEQRLSAIWAGLLGVKTVQPQDDFFELGGHSLLLVRLAAAIEREFGKAVPLSALFQGPTIEKIAAYLRLDAPPETRCIVPFQEHTTGPAFYCVHSVSGEVFSYKTLRKYLAPEVRLYGIQLPPEWRDSGIASSIESMAARYVEELLAFQPEGPYNIGGWSAGAPVALEMAQRLQERGHTVRLLASIDGGLFNTGAGLRPSHPLYYVKLLRNLPRWAALTFSGSHAAELIWRRLCNKTRGKIDACLARLRGESTIKYGVRGYLGADFNESDMRVMESIYTAVYAYTPRPYQGGMVLYEAQIHPLTHLLQSGAAWSKIAPQIEIIPVEGGHSLLMDEPHVRTVAADLSKRLRSSDHE